MGSQNIDDGSMECRCPREYGTYGQLTDLALVRLHRHGAA
jgi:hypothetical protein